MTSAYEALQAFVAHYGVPAGRLLYLVSPLARMRAEIVGLIRRNFHDENARDDTALDAYVLFGELTRPLGGGYYALLPEIRWLAMLSLEGLSRERNLDESLGRRIARFLQAYAARAAQTSSEWSQPQYRSYIHQMAWSAYALLNPERAAEDFAQRIHDEIRGDRSGGAGLVLSRLSEAVQSQFGKGSELMSYAAFVQALRGDDSATAREHFRSLAAGELSVGAVILPRREAVLSRFNISFDGETHSAQEPLATETHQPSGPELVDEMDLIKLYEVDSPANTSAPTMRADIIAAATANDVDHLHDVADPEAYLHARDDLDRTALHLAAAAGARDVVAFLLARDANIKAKDRAWRTPLFAAALAGHDPIVMQLLGAGADPNATDRRGMTPLHAAVQRGDAALVGRLAAVAKDVDHGDDRQATPLHHAIAFGNNVAFETLVGAGANPRARTSKEWSGLLFASWRGSLTLANRLVDLGCDLNAPTFDGWWPLHIAAYKGNSQFVAWAVQLGSPVDSRLKGDGTALLIAAFHGHLEVIDRLIESGARVDAADNFGWTALTIAFSTDPKDGRQHPENLERVLERLVAAPSADANIQTDGGWSAAHVAARYGSAEAARLVFSTPRINPNLLTVAGWHPLHLAASTNRQAVRAILAHPDVQLSTLNPTGQTVFEVAIAHGNAELLYELACDKRMPPSLADKSGRTLLEAVISDSLFPTGWTPPDSREPPKELIAAVTAAAREQQKQQSRDEAADPTKRGSAITPHTAYAIVLAQFDKGLSLNHRGQHGEPILHAAVKSTHALTWTRLLLELGADIHANGGGDNSALLLAAAEAKMHLVELLLEHGAQVDHRNVAGETALHAAARHSQLANAHILLNSGADPDARSHSALTPLDLAVDAAADELVQLLLERGAKPEHPDTIITPLGRALTPRVGDSEAIDKIVQLLINAGANLEREVSTDADELPASYLDLAIRARRPKALEMLLSAATARPAQALTRRAIEQHSYDIALLLLHASPEQDEPARIALLQLLAQMSETLDPTQPDARYAAQLVDALWPENVAVIPGLRRTLIGNEAQIVPALPEAQRTRLAARIDQGSGPSENALSLLRLPSWSRLEANRALGLFESVAPRLRRHLLIAGGEPGFLDGINSVRTWGGDGEGNEGAIVEFGRYAADGRLEAAAYAAMTARGIHHFCGRRRSFFEYFELVPDRLASRALPFDLLALNLQLGVDRFGYAFPLLSSTDLEQTDCRDRPLRIDPPVLTTNDAGETRFDLAVSCLDHVFRIGGTMSPPYTLKADQVRLLGQIRAPASTYLFLGGCLVRMARRGDEMQAQPIAGLLDPKNWFWLAPEPPPGHISFQQKQVRAR